MKNVRRIAEVSLIRVLRIAMFFVLLLPGILAAAHQDNLIFILDGSGSMWGELDGRPKMDLAKEALIYLIQDQPEERKVGLVAYGHRRKGDCSDIEELVELGPLEKEGFVSAVKSLSPKGQTPIEKSIRKTAERLRMLEEETTIVLVSDGIETCGGSPCEAVKELKQSGIEFKMHVVGLDVTDDESVQLECIADAGGGIYSSADNLEDLEIAIEKVSSVEGYLRVRATNNGQPYVAKVELYPAGGEEMIDGGQTTLDEGIAFALTPGGYKVRVTGPVVLGKTQIVTFEDVVIEAGERVEKLAEFAAGQLQVRATNNGQPYVAKVELYPAGGEEMIDGGQTTLDEGIAFALTPGGYKVRITGPEVLGKTQIVTFEDVVIETGERVEKLAEFAAGQLQVRATNNGQPYVAKVELYSAGGEEMITSGETSRKDGLRFALNPDRYKVRVLGPEALGKPQALTFDDLDIEGGQTLEKIAAFAQGHLQVHAKDTGQPYRAKVELYPIGSEEPIALTDLTPGQAVRFALVPGRYKIRVLRPEAFVQERIVEFPDILVKAGQAVEKRIVFEEGYLQVRASDNGRPFGATVELYKFGGKELIGSWTGKPETGVRLTLEPGRYYVLVVGPDVLGEAQTKTFEDVAVETGQTVEKLAAFETGYLQVRATRDGRHLRAYVLVYRRGDSAPLSQVRRIPDQGPFSCTLRPGAYRIKVEDRSIPFNPSVDIEGVEIRPSETEVVNAVFKPDACLNPVEVRCGDLITGKKTTGGKEDSKFDAYPSCYPGIDESGPENIYVFRPATQGSVTVMLSGLQRGKDLDLFALKNACVADACTASGNNWADFAFQPRETWYIVVDGNRGASGPYNLTVECR